ncbi:hypothetical protein [Nocardia sp. NPDC004123]
MTIFVYIVLGFLVLVLAPLAVFFALLTVRVIVTAIVHRDSRPRPRRRSGSFDTFGISSETSHSDITPHHGGHHHGGHHHGGHHHGGHHHDSGGHHGGHSDSGGHHTTSWTD